jgi:phosphate transport system substrate-binding protein
MRISGSTSMAPVLRELAATYTKQHGNVRVEVLGNDSQAGLRELEAGVVDIAAVSWKEAGQELPADLLATPFGRDAIAIIVHPRNRIAGLTLVQIRSIYRGEVLDWQAVGGPPGEPIVISREEGSGTRDAFEFEVMNGESVTLNAVVMPSAQAVAEIVGRRPEAIGYVSTAVLTDTVRAVPVEDLLPTPANVRSGAYHLTRYLYLITPSSPDPQVRQFLDFIGGSGGQAIIARYHIPLR